MELLCNDDERKFCSLSSSSEIFKKIDKYEKIWEDIDYPNRPRFKILEIDAEILRKIREDMI